MTIGQSGEIEQNRWSQVTLEHLLYAFLLLTAGFVRFFALGLHPLMRGEATNSWLAWLAAHGQMQPDTAAATLAEMSAPNSPLLYALHSLLFWIGADGDVAARWAPALFGTLLVLLPWYLRPYFGRTWALTVALLLAIDPWLTAYSRLADGLILSIFFGMLTLVSILRLGLPVDGSHEAAESARQRWLYLSAVSAGLLLVSGVGAWSFVPVLIFAAVLTRIMNVPFARSGVFAASQVTMPEAADEHPATNAEDLEILGTEEPVATSVEVGAEPNPTSAMVGSPGVALLLFGAAAILGATGWLSQPAALGYVSTSLTDWFGQLLYGSAAVYPAGWLWLRLLVDQPLLLAFGLPGLLLLWRKRPQREGLNRSWPIFLTGWLAWGLLWALSDGRGPLMLPMLGLPLLLAAAHLVDWLLAQYTLSLRLRLYNGEMAWRETLLLVAALAILTITALFWMLAFVNNQQFDTGIFWITLLVLGLAAVLVVGFMFWTNWRQGIAVVGMYGGLLLLGATVSSSWQLNQTVDPLLINGFFAETSSADVRNLVEDLEMLSSQRVGDATESPLVVQMRAAPDPVLAWYSRKMRRLHWAVAPTAEATSERMPLLITFADSPPSAQVAAGYSGSRYSLRASWLPTELLGQQGEATPDLPIQERLTQAWSSRYRPLLRWMLFRKFTQAPTPEQLVLWAPGS